MTLFNVTHPEAVLEISHSLKNKTKNPKVTLTFFCFLIKCNQTHLCHNFGHIPVVLFMASRHDRSYRP